MGVDLRSMLNPKSVAIIGASQNPEKVGHIILQNYINSGYAGKLFAINKDAESILGVKAYRHIGEIKERLDLAVIAIPAPFVPQVLEECGKAGVRSTIVVTAGFEEIGQKELQDKIVEISERYKMPMLGPNCLGVIDTRARTDTLFLPTYKLSKPGVGYVSFISQSGAAGSTILDLIAGEGFGLSKFISYGNAAYIDESDILEYLMNDDDTKVIIMYIEGIKNGKKFIEVARKVTKKKPVVVLKGGRTSVGQQATLSHTASLAGDYQVYEGIFQQFGFTIANDLNDLLYYAKTLVSEPAPKGNRIGIITNGGGAGVITTDAVGYTRELKLAELSDKSKQLLRKKMPPLVNIRIPLDLAGDAGGDRYETAVAAMRDDPNIDMIIVIALFQTPGADSGVVAKLVHFKADIEKPMIVISIGAEYTQIHNRMMEESGLPVYDSPSAAVKALAELYKYYNYKGRK
jgi:acetyl coenzyme A synthetase (ADP forming)-like protein